MQEKHDKIPLGRTCYYIESGPTYNEDGKSFFQAKVCPFYKHIIGLEGFCSKCDCRIFDAEKLCGLNESENEYDYE